MLRHLYFLPSLWIGTYLLVVSYGIYLLKIHHSYLLGTCFLRGKNPCPQQFEDPDPHEKLESGSRTESSSRFVNSHYVGWVHIRETGSYGTYSIYCCTQYLLYHARVQCFGFSVNRYAPYRYLSRMRIWI